MDSSCECYKKRCHCSQIAFVPSIFWIKRMLVVVKHPCDPLLIQLIVNNQKRNESAHWDLIECNVSTHSFTNIVFLPRYNSNYYSNTKVKSTSSKRKKIWEKKVTKKSPFRMRNSSVATLNLREVMLGGVDMTHINDGGPECASESSLNARAIETLIVILVAIVEIRRGLKLFRESSQINLNTKRILGSQRRTFLLVLLTLTFGIEIGFKLVNRQVSKFRYIWAGIQLLNNNYSIVKY